MKALVFLCVVTGAALVYLMSVASSNNAFFAQNYGLLFYLGVALAVGLASLIGYQVLLLRRKLRDRVFGSKLTLRLMLVFALMALIPDAMATSLANSQAIDGASLERLREQHSVEEATLMTARGRIIAQSGSEPVA